MSSIEEVSQALGWADEAQKDLLPQIIEQHQSALAELKQRLGDAWSIVKHTTYKGGLQDNVTFPNGLRLKLMTFRETKLDEITFITQLTFKDVETDQEEVMNLRTKRVLIV